MSQQKSGKEREEPNAYGAFEAVGLEVEKYTQVKIVLKTSIVDDDVGNCCWS